MRSIASASVLSRRVNQPLRVHWRRTDDMNCSFADLFDTQHLPFDVRESNAYGWRAPFVKVATRAKEFALHKFGVPVLDARRSAALAGQDDVLRAWASTGNPWIRTCSKLVDDEQLFSIFRPTQALEEVIDTYRPRLSNAVGVHIRRSDNARATQFSPAVRFVELMHAELARKPGTQFFVATDSPETFTSLLGEFGDSIFAHKKTSLDRSDPAALRDALIDLYCLANCRMLLGSYWSSFSDTAWEIRGIDHIIVRDSAVANAGQLP